MGFAIGCKLLLLYGLECKIYYFDISINLNRLFRKHSNGKKRKEESELSFLLLSLLCNLGLLFVFKYFNFFNDAFAQLYNSIFAPDYSVGSLRILLPVGISFYTFQTLSYTIDVY